VFEGRLLGYGQFLACGAKLKLRKISLCVLFVGESYGMYCISLTSVRFHFPLLLANIERGNGGLRLSRPPILKSLVGSLVSSRASIIWSARLLAYVQQHNTRETRVSLLPFNTFASPRRRHGQDTLRVLFFPQLGFLNATVHPTTSIES